MKKYMRLVCLMLCGILLLGSLPAGAEAQVKITNLKLSGFTADGFSGDTTYYLCHPTDFEGISITSITTNIAATSTIKVERYCDCDYPVTYTKGQTLKLGYGRARIYITVQSNSNANNTRTYLFTLTDPNQHNYRYRFFRGTTKVYSSASTSSGLVATLNKGTSHSSMPLCVGTSGSWTKIVIPSGYTAHHGKIGWVKTADLVDEYPIITPPAIYENQLAALKKAHPNWTFEYRYMNVSMQDYVNTVSGQTVANMSGSGTGKDQIAYFMDPINFFNEQNIFMFLDVSRYNASDYTSAGCGAVWTEKSTAVISEGQAIDYILKAQSSLHTNAYFITSRAAIESGHGTSNLAKGKPGGDGKIYYNFYGIGAYDNNPSNGSTYAQRRNWDTPFRSIVEGANWFNDQYTQRGQNTPYFLRFYPYRKDHIYMSDLAAPRTEAGMLYKAYKAAGKLNSKLKFIIPVYMGLSYTDVRVTDWFYDDVNRATEYGLFAGMDDGSFKPNQSLTRAQMAAVLSRISGENISGQTVSKFTDVKKSAWYYRSVAWCYNNGVVAGTSATTFDPEKPISRQELCTMLTRFAEKYKIKMPSAPLKFTDNASIATWARDSVAKCVGDQLIAGMPDGRFCPTQVATRAQASRILSLFYEAYFFMV